MQDELTMANCKGYPITLGVGALALASPQQLRQLCFHCLLQAVYKATLLRFGKVDDPY